MSKDSPGFIANAILMPMINEAVEVLEKVRGCNCITRRVDLCRVPLHPKTLILRSASAWDTLWDLCGLPT